MDILKGQDKPAHSSEYPKNLKVQHVDVALTAHVVLHQ